jgi:hypothetical protein
MCRLVQDWSFAPFPNPEHNARFGNLHCNRLLQVQQKVAHYVFWIHHEEIEGQFDWSGKRNLRHFIELCREVGLQAVVRCGPWCHGEARNGGQPDWLLKKGWRICSDDLSYLEKVRILYGEIAQNSPDYCGKMAAPSSASNLKMNTAVPPRICSPSNDSRAPRGSMCPSTHAPAGRRWARRCPWVRSCPYGTYAEGFWDRDLKPMPGRYWTAFHFSLLRTDSAIATDILGERAAKDAPDAAKYPYLTCKIGGGMMNSYHRRILVYPADIESTTLIKLGSGSTSPGESRHCGSEQSLFLAVRVRPWPGCATRLATAQPVTAIDDSRVRTVFFAETDGVPTEFAFNGAPKIEARSGKATRSGDRTIVRNVKPGTSAALRISSNDGSTVRVVLFDSTASLALWNGQWQGRERGFLTEAELVLDGKQVPSRSDGVFKRFAPRMARPTLLKATYESIQPAGPPREIPLGKIRQPVAAAPEDPDFEKAAVWRVQLPSDVDLGTDPILRLHYVGDVARVILDGKLLTDDFYNGNAFDIGLRRHAPRILNGDLRIAILPLRKDAPIYLGKEARPDFGKTESLVELQRVEIIPRYQAQLTAR